MNTIEVSALLGMIEGQSCLRPKSHQIGNGEWVVIVQGIWLWSFDDWTSMKFMWHKSLYTMEVHA